METEATKELRDGMIKFERAVLQQANLSVIDKDESKWVADALSLAGRLCCAVRACLPMDKDA